MTNFTRNVTILILASLLGSAPALAQSNRGRGGPAEYPPETYKGTQYVDSKGCVYVRAGYAGGINWVPRMARNRTVVCGFQPSNVAGSTATPARPDVTVIAAATPEAGGTSTGVTATAAATTARVAAATPRSAPTRVTAPPPTRVASAPAPRPAPVAAPRVVAQAPVVRSTAVTGPTYRPAPQYGTPTARVPAAPVIEARPRVVVPSAAPAATTQVATVCGGLSSNAQRYISLAGQMVVRCGPQRDYNPYGAAGRPAIVAAAPQVVTPSYAAPRAANITVPNYDARAPRPVTTTPVAVADVAPSAAAAVTTVPRTQVRRVAPAQRRAIAPTARVLPRHVYEENLLSQEGVRVPKGYRPVWEDDRLNARRAEQTLAGKRQMEMVWTQTVPRKLVPVDLVAPTGAQATYPAVPNYANRVARVSSRSAAPQAAQPQVQRQVRAQPQPQVRARSGLFVQVASPQTPANAQAIAQRIAASGLPVRIQNTSNGQLVMAGPFGNDRDVGNALTIARRAGFPGAYPRR